MAPRPWRSICATLTPMTDRSATKPLVRVLQHAEPEIPGLIGEILEDRGVELEVVRPFAGDPVATDPIALQGLVVMGGPMGVYEAARFPHLNDETELIRNAVARGIPVLGVCLGSQLLAAALGARVEPGVKEIGWFPVHLTPEAAADPLFEGLGPTFTPFHWHGDRFDLPPGAVSLARSDRTACQAFRHGPSAYGLLFHAEMSEPMIRGMVDAFDDELETTGEDGAAILARAATAIPEMRRAGRTLFGRWATLLDSPGGSLAS